MTTTVTNIEQKELPAGWKWVKLGDVAKEIYAGGDAPKANLSKDMTEAFQVPVISNGIGDKSLYGYTNIPRVLEPAITISARGTIGHAEIREEPFYPIIRLIVFIPDKDILDIMYSKFAIQSLNLTSVGTSIPQLTVPMIKNYDFPLPPLEEQKRIAGILNEQMAAVEEAKKAAQERLEAAQALPAAYLREVFEGEEAQGWPIKFLGDIGQVAAGITLGRKTGSTPVESIPYLRVANVKDGYLDLDDIKQIEATKSEIEKLLLESGDLLLTEGGDPDKLGRGTIWEGQLEQCIHQNHIYRVRFAQNAFSPEFLSKQIGSSYGKDYFLTHAKQTTGIATINQTVLKGFPFHIPPLEEQERIASELDDKIAGVKLAEASIQQELDAIEAMPAALLRKAFSGGL